MQPSHTQLIPDVPQLTPVITLTMQVLQVILHKLAGQSVNAAGKRQVEPGFASNALGI